jgi:Tol biopolymer transport system component
MAFFMSNNRRCTIAALVVVLILLAGLLPPSNPALAQTAVTLNPASGLSGTEVTATGRWSAGHEIKAHWDDGTVLREATVDSSGGFTVSFTVPANAPEGRHTMHFVDVPPDAPFGGSRYSIPATFTVTGPITRVSVSSTGQQVNAYFREPSISGDGRFVAFVSDATNLVPGDTNNWLDVFVHDRYTGETTLASVSSTGQQGIGHSYKPSISADGRFVAFVSEATNLVPNDTNDWDDVFVHDRQTGVTTLVSVSSTGQQGTGYSDGPSISADGQFVAFVSSATNLVPDDAKDWLDVFVHDRQTGETALVSVSSKGEQANGGSASFASSISADGRFVAFISVATNLVPDDTNNWDDVFVHDRQTEQTTLVSVSSTGQQGDSYIREFSLSADGRFVAFSSAATNLVPDNSDGRLDVFVHDRQTEETTLASVGVNSPNQRQQANGDSFEVSISADGRFVAFSSDATSQLPHDTNGLMDVFVHDRQAGKTTLVSVSTADRRGNNVSYSSSISADGRVVAFVSEASNLVPDDTNDWLDVFVHDRSKPGGREKVVVFLHGILSSSSAIGGEDDFEKVKKDFSNIEGQLKAIDVSQFAYFSYSAATHHQAGKSYCNGWAKGCTGDKLASPSATPVYGTDDTKLRIDLQVAALDWLLLQILEQKPTTQIDLVGFSLGGIVASYWLSGDWMPGVNSAFKLHKDKVHSLVLIESPVGGVPASNNILHDCKLTDKPVCDGIRDEVLFPLFGEDVPHQLHVPKDDLTRRESIIDSLPKAVGRVPVTSIQSSNDYFVNRQEISVCVDPEPEGGCGRTYKTSVGLGSQNWPQRTLYCGPLGGGLPAEDRDLLPEEVDKLLNENHNEPLENNETAAQWVKDAVSGVIKPNEKTGEC